jgi:hypothetical protein
MKDNEKDYIISLVKSFDVLNSSPSDCVTFINDLKIRISEWESTIA